MAQLSAQDKSLSTNAFVLQKEKEFPRSNVFIYLFIEIVMKTNNKFLYIYFEFFFVILKTIIEHKHKVFRSGILCYK